MKRLLCIAAALLALAGCARGPKYTPEPYTHAPEFVNQQLPGYAGGEVEVAWWTRLNDATLNDLIARAAAHNHDLRIAKANLRAARELLFQTRRDLFPVVTASGGYTVSESSAQTDGAKAASGGGPSKLQQGLQIAQTARSFQAAQQTVDKALIAANALTAQGQGGASIDRSSNLFQGGFDASWEADLFGRVQYAVDAQQAELGRVEALERDVLVSVFAEVAQNYMGLRGTQNQLAVARRNAENQQQTYKLTQDLLEGGRGTDLDTARAHAQLASTLATIPPLEASIERTIYRLGVLVGEEPSALTGALRPVQPMPPLPEVVNIGTPEQLFRRRPDIQAAERAVAASVAQVGVATADLFPRITFVGSAGPAVGNLADIFNANALAFSFGPRIQWAAFDLGRVRSRIREADARSDAALANYEAVVLRALQETDQTLVTFAKEKDRARLLGEATTASRKAVDLATQRYQFGVDNFLTVLDAQRRQLESESLLADSQTNTALALIAVYKALAGGWESEAGAMP